MAFIAQSRRNNFWFGTEQRMGWFKTPNRGANMSASGWSDGGTLLNGGLNQLNSFGSARNYVFEWPQSSSIADAQTMKSYADGTYGRGLIYFLDPLIYETNILPAMWADPSMAIGYEGASLAYGVDPTGVPTPTPGPNNLPVTSAFYDLAGVAAGWRGKENAVFIPVPEGHTLGIGAVHTRTGTGRVFARVQTSNGALGAITEIATTASTATSLFTDTFQAPDLAGVWLYIGRNAVGAGSVTLSAMTARLNPVVNPNAAIAEGPWVGGQGHSGCRFLGKPTYVANTGVNDGQVGFAASFAEVGSWVYG